MSKHTPGPWEVLEDKSMISVVTECAEICDIVHDVRPVSENLANARLIAAAPEMLEALESVLRVVDLGNASGDSAEAFAEWSQEHETMAQAVYAAVKKARGEE